MIKFMLKLITFFLGPNAVLEKAKLKAYGCTDESLILINSYLTNRKHSIKLNCSYGSFLDLLIKRIPYTSEIKKSA